MKLSIIKFQFLILVTCYLLLVACSVQAAVLYLLPQNQTVYSGDSFIAEIRLDTEGQEINVVEVDLNFPSSLLGATDFSKGGSILTLWAREPKIQPGEISFIGGVPKGFNGQGTIGMINFSAEKVGKTEVRFKEEDCKVLLNDGKGTEAELTFLTGSYEIIKKPEGLPVISSKSHPDQNKWYKAKTLHLHWDLIEGAEYSYLLSHDPLAEPDEIPDKPEGELIWMGDIEYKGLEDGIYYFHLREKRGIDAEQRGKWGPKISFRAMIDATPPGEFEPQIAEIEGKKYLVFVTDDKTSGIEHYEVKEGKRDFKRAMSPYLLEDQSLRSRISVKAADKAGNERTAEIVPPYKITWKDILPWVILGLIVAGVIWWVTRNKRQVRKIN